MVKKRISRKEFLRLTGTGLASFAALPMIGCSTDTSSLAQDDSGPERDTQDQQEETDPRNEPGTGDGTSAGSDSDTDRETGPLEKYFYVAILADTHIIDQFYIDQGRHETPGKDDVSIRLTSQRLIKTRDHLNALDPPIEMVHVAGDVVHDYPSTDWEFFFANETRFDICKQILDGFKAPVYIDLGNHDYDIGNIPRDFTHALFQEKFGVRPYYSIDHKGWKFIHLNNFLGDTQNPESWSFNKLFGSFGEEQLNWLDGELASGLPSLVFWHFPLYACWSNEILDLSIRSVLKKHSQNVMLTITGHSHIWMNTGGLLGAPQFVCASTRYDPDAYMILRLSTEDMSYKIMNRNCFHWLSHDTDPYHG